MMKKFWETERAGSHIYIICRVQFADGRIGGASRSIHRTEWEFSGKHSQQAHLQYTIQSMNNDIEQLAQKHGAK